MTMGKQNMTRQTMSLPEDVVAYLDDAARKHCTSRNAEVVRAVRERMEADERAAAQAAMLSIEGVLVRDVGRAEIARLTTALEFYANPDVYRPHPHGPAFDRRDLSYVAQARREALEEAAELVQSIGRPVQAVAAIRALIECKERTNDQEV